jgi:hypothetical protein
MDSPRLLAAAEAYRLIWMMLGEDQSISLSDSEEQFTDQIGKSPAALT